MKLPKVTLPKVFSENKIEVSPIQASMPFFIKECGFCNETKFVKGQNNNFNDYLLLYSIEGTVRYSKYKTPQYIHQHSVVISACNTPLTFTKVSKEWIFIYIIISGSHSKLFYNLVRSNDNKILNDPFSPILSYFLDIYSINTTRNEKNETWVALHTSNLIQNIFSELYDLAFTINKVKALTPPKDTDINSAIKYIKENYSGDLSVDTVCSKVGYSKYYFCKLFKEQTGKTIHQYVNEYRISKSKELLSYTKLSINTISQQVGFKTPLTYMRTFKEIEKMTPSEYRTYF